MNTFPPPERALTEEGELRGDTEAFLTVLTDLLLSNAGETKEEQLFRNVLQRGFRETYRRVRDRAPLYSDLYETLQGLLGREDVDQEKLRVVLELLGGFLSSQASRLFNRPSSATPDAAFLILDLYGIDSLDSRVAQAVTFLVCQ